MVDFRNPTETKVILCFGDVEISENILSCQVHLSTNAPNTVEAKISNETLIRASPNYQSEARVLYSVDGVLYPQFTGFVVAVEPQESEPMITMASDLQKTREQMLGGLAFGGVSAPEIIWAMIRSTGRDPDKIDIEGYEPGPLEVFEVATALDGIIVEEPTALGEVRLLPSGPVSRMAYGQKGPPNPRSVSNG